MKKLVKVPGQGSYQVNPEGTVIFDPLPGFTGTAAALTYRVSDWFDQATRSTITVTVTPITPVAVDDVAKTPYEKTVAVKVLTNDKAGDRSAPLVPGSLLLTDPADGLLQATVTIPNEGVYTAAGGAVTFDPGATFRGPGTQLTYPSGRQQWNADHCQSVDHGRAATDCGRRHRVDAAGRRGDREPAVQRQPGHRCGARPVVGRPARSGRPDDPVREEGDGRGAGHVHGPAEWWCRLRSRSGVPVGRRWRSTTASPTRTRTSQPPR